MPGDVTTVACGRCGQEIRAKVMPDFLDTWCVPCVTEHDWSLV